MAMSENTIKVINYLQGLNGADVTANDVAEALGLTGRQVNGIFTGGIQRKDLGIRDYPDPNSGYLKNLNRNDKVTILGYNHKGYYKIKHNDIEGFIHGDYLSDEKTIGRTVAALFTAYYPADNALEGGFYDARGNLLDPSKNTCAAPKSIPLGTKIMITGTGTKYDGQIFTVTDRGGGITVNDGVYDIDILMSSNSECNAWGRRKGQIIILD